MGMIGNLIRVSEKDLAIYRADSGKLETLIYRENGDHTDWYLDLDKTWEGIHFLLAGNSLAETEMDNTPKSILAYTIFSDHILDAEQNLGYGPAFYNDPERVKSISQELNKLNMETLEASFDGNQLNDAGVYPQLWDEEDAKSYLFDNLKEVIRFYSSAAKNKQAVIGFIN